MQYPRPIKVTRRYGEPMLLIVRSIILSFQQKLILLKIIPLKYYPRLEVFGLTKSCCDFKMLNNSWLVTKRIQKYKQKLTWCCIEDSGGWRTGQHVWQLRRGTCWRSSTCRSTVAVHISWVGTTSSSIWWMRCGGVGTITSAAWWYTATLWPSVVL